MQFIKNLVYLITYLIGVINFKRYLENCDKYKNEMQNPLCSFQRL